MKYIKSMIIVGATLLVTVIVFAQKPVDDQQNEGGESYNPTKLEWLHLWATANISRSICEPNETLFVVNFTADVSTPNTLTMLVAYSPYVEDEMMKQHVERLNKSLKDYADKKGWSWLKLKTKYTELESWKPKSKKPKNDSDTE